MLKYPLTTDVPEVPIIMTIMLFGYDFCTRENHYPAMRKVIVNHIIKKAGAGD